MKIKVRIALAVDHTGNWSATGYKRMKDEDAFDFIVDSLESGEAHYWLTAEVDAPEQRELPAAVERAE